MEAGVGGPPDSTRQRRGRLQQNARCKYAMTESEMTQTNSLGALVREVTEHARPTPNEEEQVIIDARTGQSVAQPSFLEALTGEFRYFLVTTGRAQNKIIRGTKSGKYKEGQEEVFIAIGYEGGCRPGFGWLLAQVFFNSSRTEDVLSESLARWLIEYFSTGARTIDDFYREKANACDALATRAAQEFGLGLNVTLQLEGADKLETVEFGPLMISSRLKDSDEEESVWLRAEIEVDQQLTLRALLSKNQPLTELLTKGVRRYLGTYVTLECFYRDLATEQIREGLRRHLNGLLEPVGRKVGFLSLRTDNPPPPSFKGETVIEYLHHEYPDPIKIKVSVLMIPTMVARYRAKGSPKLDAWLDQSLREVVGLTLFGVSYVDLLLDFALLKQKIGEALNQRAQEFGYNIEQLMSILYLEPFEWLKRIDIEIKDAAPSNGSASEAMFETSISNIHVGLEIFLTARVKDLRGISDYLSAKLDVPRRMKEEIIRLVRKLMHATDPERFYMRYSRPDPENYPGEPSFEEEVRQKIQALLEEEFNAEVLGLVLKPVQTDLTMKLSEVSKGAHDFLAEAEVGNLPGAPGVVVKGSFKVLGVSGWQAFRECDASVAAIRKRIQDSVRARLKCARDEQAALYGETGLTGLIDDALAAARKLIGDEFGLAVSLMTTYWDWDEDLKQIGRQQGQSELRSVRERILKLKELLLDLHENDASPNDIRNVEERIRRLSATLSPSLASSLGTQRLIEPTATEDARTTEPDERNT